MWAPWQELEPDLQQGILELSEQWVADKALPEMGFTLGTLEELKDPDTRILLAIDEQRAVHGVTSWLPVYEQGRIAGFTLDFMRRSVGSVGSVGGGEAEAFRPVIEFLLAEGVVKAKEMGCQWVSLSGAPLAPPQSLVDENGDPVVRGALDTALDMAGGMLEPLYGFRSLAASKYKFHPEHQSWFMCYDDELALPAIGLAVSHCYLPQLRMKDGLAVIQQWVRGRGEKESQRKREGRSTEPAGNPR